MAGELLYNERCRCYEGTAVHGGCSLRVPLRAMAEARYRAIWRGEPLGKLMSVTTWIARPDLLGLTGVAVVDVTSDRAGTAVSA